MLCLDNPDKGISLFFTAASCQDQRSSTPQKQDRDNRARPGCYREDFHQEKEGARVGAQRGGLKFTWVFSVAGYTAGP